MSLEHSFIHLEVKTPDKSDDNGDDEDNHNNVDSATSGSTLSSYVVDEKALDAQILWCLNLVNSHYSYRSCEPLQNLFKRMQENLI